MPNPTQPEVTPDNMPVDPPSGESTPPEPTKEANADAAALANDPAFQEGLDAVLDGQEPPAPMEPEPKEPKDTTPPPDKLETPDGKREGKKPDEKAKPDDKPKDEPKPEASEDEKAEQARKAQVDEEAKGLGLKEKAKERFHQLNDTIAKTAPLVQVLEKAGVKDAAALEQVIGNAQAAVDIVGMVRDTGMDAEMYTKTLDYGSRAVAASKGDLDAARANLDALREEMKFYADMLGEEVPGISDPLANHPDLQKDLEDETITRARALEIAAGRSRTAVTEGQRKQQQAQSQAEADKNKVVEQARAGLTALGQELAGTTAESQALYARLGPTLVKAVQEIAKTLPPDQWVNATRLMYRQMASLPAPAAAPPPADKGNIGPTRAAGPTPHLDKTAYQDPLDALEAGLAAADAQGG